MEGKIKKLLLATGSLMSAAVALVPLTSYAAPQKLVGIDGKYAYGAQCDDTQPGNECARSDGNTTTVNVNVKSILSLDAVASETIHVAPEMKAKGTLSATVRSAKPYTIELSAAEPSLVNVEDDSFAIRPKSDIVLGTNGWGIKKADAGENEYTAISTTPQVFFDGGPHDESTQTDFEIGVAVSNSLPQGTYATDVTVTASVK